MFGYSKLFRSRWWALAWSVAIIAGALELWAPAPDPQSTNRSIRAE